MKKIASRKLQRTCIHCNKEFIKGDVYYRTRHVKEEDGKVYAYEYLECPKCVYKAENQKERIEGFIERCEHPDEFIDTEYSYMAGECVKEPDYDYCRLCGKIV